MHGMNQLSRQSVVRRATIYRRPIILRTGNDAASVGDLGRQALEDKVNSALVWARMYTNEILEVGALCPFGPQLRRRRIPWLLTVVSPLTWHGRRWA
jgi:hypothetical protein